MKNMIIILMLTISSIASAELYKCIAADGRTSYSDTPCVSSSKSNIKTSIENNPAPTRIGEKPSWEIQHDRLIKSHISNGELDVAERLAVTSVQMNMVQNAKNEAFLKRLSKDTKTPPENRAHQNRPVHNETVSDPSMDDFNTRMKAKRDYQKQQIPGFITREPTDAHDRGVYKQEMNRQKNIDPNTWYK